MIRLTAIGNLGKDATLTNTGEHTVINFSIGVATGTKENPDTTWISCSLWDKEKLHPFLTKGMKVYISGKPEASYYTKQDQVIVAELKCTVFEIELLTPKEK